MQLANTACENSNPPFAFSHLHRKAARSRLYTDTSRSAARSRNFSAKDAAGYLELAQAFARLEKLSTQLLLTPPVIEKPSKEDLWKLLKVGRKVRGLGKKEMMRLIRWGPWPRRILSPNFSKRTCCAQQSRREEFSARRWAPGPPVPQRYCFLRAAADPFPVGNSAYPRGGMGALTAAMAAAAKKAGAEIRTSAEVKQILVKNGPVTGVALANGEEIAAKGVVSGADPRRTLLGLLDPVHLPPSFVVKMQHYRCKAPPRK